MSACEVEVDTLTGLFEIVRTDIIMDVGHSLNPAIDIGQVEGAWVQGMGRWTTEEMHWGDSKHPRAAPGTLISNNPHSYFIPSAADVPKDFRVTLLSDADNPTAVHSSKAVGEPPFFMSSSSFFAIQDAIKAAREEEGLGMAVCDAPLTSGTSPGDDVCLWSVCAVRVFFSYAQATNPPDALTERIRMACRDDFANYNPDARIPGSY